MLVLFETPAGHALFKLLDATKLKKPDDLRDCFETAEKTRKLCVHAPPCKHQASSTRATDSPRARSAARGRARDSLLGSRPCERVASRGYLRSRSALAHAFDASSSQGEAEGLQEV